MWYTSQPPNSGPCTFQSRLEPSDSRMKAPFAVPTSTRILAMRSPPGSDALHGTEPQRENHRAGEGVASGTRPPDPTIPGATFTPVGRAPADKESDASG